MATTSRTTSPGPDSTRNAVDVPWGLIQLFTEISQFLQTLERQYGIANQEFTEYAVNRLTVCLRGVSSFCSTIAEAGEEVSDVTEYFSDLQVLRSVLNSLIILWERYEETLESASGQGSDVSYTASFEQTGRRGRPRFMVAPQQLEYLRSLSFSWTEITSLLGVSRMTVYRRRAECGLLDDQRDTLSDADLDTLITELRQDLPYSGQSVILGHLRNLGYYTNRVRVRESIRRTDPLNTPQRWGGGAHQRRPYSVAGPNSLWHLGMKMHISGLFGLHRFEKMGSYPFLLCLQ